MRELTYLRADDAAHAVATVSGDPHARFLGGGTNLVDHLKLGITTPETLVDVSRLPLDAIEETDDGLLVGAAVRNSDLAAHPVVRTDFPALSRALLAGASGQIRNQATTAGNLLQRTRCVYFQDTSTPCNKREPGSGCSALGGYDRYNAVLGASEACVAVHPSDMAVGLAVLDAEVVVLGPDGQRSVPLDELHRWPGHQPEHDTTLAHGELVTGVRLRRSAAARHSTYEKARDRASYAFALVSVAAALDLDDEGRVRDVRVAWGGAAHKPWRARRAEELLAGEVLDEARVRDAVAEELRAASTSSGNAYKTSMLTGITARALVRLAEAAR